MPSAFKPGTAAIPAASRGTRGRASLLAASLLIAALILATQASVRPALADTTLCSGSYGACTSAGYTDHGYGANNGHMYWSEFPGHNCTNYVAWVEQAVNGAATPSPNHLGYPFEWDNNAAADGITVNATPGLGSVAQWEAGYHGADRSDGHVAYVEGITRNGDGSVQSITVSEDNAPSGPFDWRVITPSGGSWPSNFIHFKDLPGPPSGWGGIGTATFLGTDTLGPGSQIGSNQYLMSADARFALILQADGNLVLYNGHAVWSSGTAGTGATHLVMQTDGNLVLYTASNAPVWWSGTGGTGQAHLVVQTDGNVVTYNNTSGNPTWWTATGGHTGTSPFGSATLPAGSQLNASAQQYLLSPDMRYGLLLQSDGNLVLYGPGYHVLWQSATSGATRLVMQADGNLVLYDNNTALWQSGTGGTGSGHAVMQSDGNFVTYNDTTSTATWSTGTVGQL